MILAAGDKFPEFEFPDLGGRMVPVPEVFGEHWGVLLFYRGQW